MLDFEIEFDIASHGWADLQIRADDRVLKTRCSNTSNDCLREWIVALVNLAAARGKQEIVCYSEPSETIFTVRKVGNEIEIIAKRFLWEGDTMPTGVLEKARQKQSQSVWRKARKARNKKAVLRYKGPFAPAVIGFADAFRAAVTAIGLPRYKSTWGYEYPAEDMSELERAVVLARKGI